VPEKVTAYCLDLHATGAVSSAEDILVDPMAESAEIDLRAWDGEHFNESLSPTGPTVFYMFPPPPELASTPDARIVWIPMWDQARSYDQGWWEALPGQIRVVALSDAVSERARAAGLHTLDLRFHLDPALFGEAEWTHGRVAAYWNRTGMLSPAALERLCKALSLDRLIFRDQLDPRIPPEMRYDLPERLGDTEVISIAPSSREEYLEITEPANIHIAPRASEGVGVTFLEAMARGCCVLAYDAPTMNEYIRDEENGLLFVSSFSRLHPAALLRLARRSPHQVNVDQPWRRFARADHAALGARARSDQLAGHRRWVESLPAYRSFLLDR
jgi:hypothetical protein